MMMMMMMRCVPVAVALMTGLIGMPAWSEDFRFTEDSACSPVRLDETSSVKQIPVLNQGGSQFCSGYAAATLLDDLRIRTGRFNGNFTSPMSLFFQYQKHTGRFQVGSAPTIDLLTELPKFVKSCSSPLLAWLDHSTIIPPRGLNLLGQCSADARQQLTRTNSGQSESALVEACIRKVPVHGEALASAVRTHYPKAGLSHPREWAGFVAALTESACTQNPLEISSIPSPLITRIRTGEGQGSTMNRMKAALNSSLEKNVPAGISYCLEVLKDIDAEGVNFGVPGNGAVKAGKCSPHASVIIGRRLLKYVHQGKPDTICQYLVRDSMGESCDGYPDDPTSQPSAKCEKGNVWVDENALLNNVIEVWRFP